MSCFLVENRPEANKFIVCWAYNKIILYSVGRKMFRPFMSFSAEYVEKMQYYPLLKK